MDDTVVFAISREKLHTKLKLLKNYADDIGMILHPTKSEYLTVYSNDEAPFNLQDVAISKTNKYMYLGALISNQPNSSSSQRPYHQ